MLAITVEKILPLGNGSQVQSTEKRVLTVMTNAIYDAQVQAHKDEVKRLTEEVREAHSHIHADHECIHADKQQVEDDKNQVRADREQVTRDKNAVAEDKRIVAEDKAIVAQDKATTQDYMNSALSHSNTSKSHADRSNVEANRSRDEANRSSEQATVSTNKAEEAAIQAAKALSEANRAQSIVDRFAETGNIDGNLTVGGKISEGGTLLSDKYAQITYVDQQINDLKGGASSAYDTLKEIQTAIENNAGGIGTITTALGTKVSKSGDLMTGKLRIQLPAFSGWPNSTVNDSNNYIARSIESMFVNNNGLHFFGAGNENARRMGIQSAHRDSAYSNVYGILDLNPFGGAVRINGHSVYHAGNKPTWNDIGGNDVIDLTGSDSNHAAFQSKWLNAATDRGFLPDAASTTGRCRIGTSSWWFAESFVNRMFTRQLEVGDHTSSITIQKTGDVLEFLV
ncbi:hypothetical protein ACJW8F_13110 [Plesiomonas shigelloides]|uniref:hypothetical protein n=1 Tax=Plesiomonas shigelloides TaxID=703 RepID=UPI00387F170E